MCMFLCGYKFSNQLDKCQGTQLLHPMVRLFSFAIKCQTVTESGCIILHLVSNGVPVALHPYQQLYCKFLVFFLNLSHSNSCVVSYYCFNLHLHNEKWCPYFHMLIFHVYIFCGKVTFQVFCSFLNRAFCFWCCILKKNPSSNLKLFRFSLMFSSKSFIVFYFALRRMIQFENFN